MKLIINAEDLGMSEGINRGIFEGLKEGFLTSTSLFVNGKYTLEAVKTIKEMDLKNVGVHLNLTYGKPVLEKNGIKSLVEQDGNFHYMCSMPFYAKYEDVWKELDAQIQKFLSFGIKPSHLDFHHYFYSSRDVYSAYLELAKKYDLPIRSMTPQTTLIAKQYGIKTPDIFIDQFHGSYNISKSLLEQISEQLTNCNGVCELMTTPGYIDDFTQTQTNYLKREDELVALKQAFIEGVWKDFELVSFLDL